MLWFGVFALLCLHSALVGMSDDEAYYWVLSQKLSMGYAYHPPAIAWLIALFDRPLKFIFSENFPLFVRLPAILGTLFIFASATQWMKRAKVNSSRSSWVLLSFFCLSSLSWMIVPDIPLFIAWSALFYLTWKLCFEKKVPNQIYMYAAGSAALALLSKFSGVLFIFSSIVSALVFCADYHRKKKFISALLFGMMIAAIPILLWNYQHDWGALLYQFRDRHHGSLSWLRWGRFWLVQFILMGPGLIGFCALLCRDIIFKRTIIDRPIWYLCIWAAPASVYLIQPLYSDFKLHWVIVFWWPVMMAMAIYSKNNRYWKWMKFQVGYGLAMGCIILLSCHIPWLSHALSQWKGAQYDPRWDVTNDFYGWNLLRNWLDTQAPEEDRQLPVVGSRYQTASQASFALYPQRKVTLLPRDTKERDEWETIDATDTEGPGWPRVLKPVLFVADNRYSTPPEFQGAQCTLLHSLETRRLGVLAKTVYLWKCVPEKRTPATF